MSDDRLLSCNVRRTEPDGQSSTNTVQPVSAMAFNGGQRSKKNAAASRTGDSASQFVSEEA
jgi:hypothetical protein